MEITLLWVLCVALIAVGLAGTVLPLLPGTVLVWAGIVLGAWIDDFARVGSTTVVVVSVLAVLAWVLDYVAGLMGAQKAGASKQALLGAEGSEPCRQSRGCDLGRDHTGVNRQGRAGVHDGGDFCRGFIDLTSLASVR